MANFFESAICDIVLFREHTEPKTAMILHTMAESLTDKLIDMLFTKKAPPRIEVKVKMPLDKSAGHFVVSGTQEGSRHEAERLFTSQAKGIHQFHGAVFNGTLTYPLYTPKGKKIQLSLPIGFHENVPSHFMWKWTIDAASIHNRPG